MNEQSLSKNSVKGFLIVYTKLYISHSLHVLQAFPLLEQVACYLTLGTGGMLSRYWRRLHIFTLLERSQRFCPEY